MAPLRGAVNRKNRTKQNTRHRCREWINEAEGGWKFFSECFYFLLGLQEADQLKARLEKVGYSLLGQQEHEQIGKNEKCFSGSIKGLLKVIL